MQTLHDIICAVHPVSRRVSDLLSEHATARSFAKGERLVCQGARCYELFFITGGICRSLHESAGREDTRWFATSGDVITSVTALHRSEPAIFSIEAVTQVECLSVRFNDLESLLQSEPELKDWAIRLLTESLYVLERRHVIIGTGDALSRYSALLKGRPKEVINSIPLKYIAQYLKVTQETLSRVRRIYAQRGR